MEIPTLYMAIKSKLNCNLWLFRSENICEYQQRTNVRNRKINFNCQHKITNRKKNKKKIPEKNKTQKRKPKRTERKNASQNHNKKFLATFQGLQRHGGEDEKEEIVEQEKFVGVISFIQLRFSLSDGFCQHWQPVWGNACLKVLWFFALPPRELNSQAHWLTACWETNEAVSVCPDWRSIPHWPRPLHVLYASVLFR